MQPELDYEKVGQRIKAARMEKNLNQADLGALVGCSNNHISHVEIGQTKVSLPLLLKIATSLDKDFDYFLLDTPYTSRERLINTELAEKLNQCNTTTLSSRIYRTLNSKNTDEPQIIFDCQIILAVILFSKACYI